jgi:hypothetical protein
LRQRGSAAVGLGWGMLPSPLKPSPKLIGDRGMTRRE